MSDQSNRLELIDFLRGIAVLEMCVTHFSGYLPPIADKIIPYIETAMALFVVLSGFMVGWELPKFSAAQRQQTAVIWKRALRIAVIQFVIVMTLGLTLHLVAIPGAGVGEPLSVFLLRSLTLQNQIGLIHILPTFIPLFLVAPLILWALTRHWDWLVLVVSIGIFCVGHYQPYLLDIGDPTVFPFVLYQLYFVIGCLIARRCRDAGRIELAHPKRWLLVAASALTIAMVLVHGKLTPPGLVVIHPVNLFGLAYQLPILATVWLGAMAYLTELRRFPGYALVLQFGRHALLAFVIHVYLAKAIGVANYFSSIPGVVNYVLIVASVMVMSALIDLYERTQTHALVPAWARFVRALFR
jgi:hypothetical protein